MGSKNKTKLNGNELEAEKEYTLKDNDLIDLADGVALIRFRLSESTVPLSQISAGSHKDQNVWIDNEARDVYVDGKILDPALTVKEFEMLSFLCENRDKACGKDDIATHVWKNDFVTDEQIEQCIYRLRKRIEVDSFNPNRIVTLRGFGYKLTSE